MTRPELLMLAGLLVAVACGDGQTPSAVRVFDGLSLNGWEGDTALWRVVDGAIVGGTLKTGYRSLLVRLLGSGVSPIS